MSSYKSEKYVYRYECWQLLITIDNESRPARLQWRSGFSQGEILIVGNHSIARAVVAFLGPNLRMTLLRFNSVEVRINVVNE